MKYFVPEIISLSSHPELNEQWLQERIAENPELLGMGDLEVRDKERRQPAGGRLDLLLQDPDTLRRYEVEIQLGPTDESHIIRTIEYWDIERRRYPQYDHCAVIVAEDVTGRFLNVISLFNGFIPLIAIKLQAIQKEDEIGLVFTRVLDELPLGLIDEDEVAQEPTDRPYWEAKGSKRTVKMADRLCEILQDFAPGHELKYNKHYIGLAKAGQANNFVSFVPKKKTLNLHARLARTESLVQRIEEAGLDELAFDRQFRQLRLRLTPEDLDEHGDLIVQLMSEAYEGRG